MALRPLTRGGLARAARVPDEAAQAVWRDALAQPGSDAAPLVSLLEEWEAHEGLDWRAMIERVFWAQDEIAAEFTDRGGADASELAGVYDRTETLIPLLAWWHGTDPLPARCAAGAAKAISSVGGRRVLDFGCGIGSTALVLAREGFEIAMADVARAPLAFAAERMRNRGHHPAVMHLLQTPLTEVETTSFDAVVAFDVFEHLPSVEPALEQIDRILAPDGLLCFNQAYVPPTEQLPHYPQRGEALLWLAARGYRLAHVRGVLWAAQRTPLTPAQSRLQWAELKLRIAGSHAAERLPAPVAPRALAYALR